MKAVVKNGHENSSYRGGQAAQFLLWELAIPQHTAALIIYSEKKDY